MIKLEGIYKDYRQSRVAVPVLRDVNLSIEEGEYVAIMGASGSGKTTLMNILGCLDSPTEGKYFFDGENVAVLGDRRLAKIRNTKIGFVFQDFNLLGEYDALENVSLPLLYASVSRSKRRKLAEEALSLVGLSDRIDFKPNQLSGGQQQRVAIARAMVIKPRLLLADEPTGALDSAAGSALMDIFDELHKKGTTIVMITHELNIAERANRIIYIKDGQVSEEYII
ncbi:ABC transporter ATP-binding protein [Clostridiaceae bacterium OttesenSCG-928-D20]|nr:ABC transporter ATP-binding protein [Clostridiaceae bacterium OttesenSCG-928-D20]